VFGGGWCVNGIICRDKTLAVPAYRPIEGSDFKPFGIERPLSLVDGNHCGIWGLLSGLFTKQSLYIILPK